MPSTQRAWFLVVPIATLGVLLGHELAYALTGTPTEELHGYLAHAPQVALILTVLSLLGASLVRQGSRIRLWPFPAVAVTGFVAQEHLEQLQHAGSLPFLLGRPVFLIGIAIQCVIALLVWVVARLLIAVLHHRASHAHIAGRWSFLNSPSESAPALDRIVGAARPRAPPASA